VTVNSALKNDSPSIVGTTRVDDAERVNRDAIFDLDSVAEEVATVSSPVATEIIDNDEAICRMDAESLVRNIELVSDTIVPETVVAELSSIFTPLATIHVKQQPL
jgi:hypothetical protein